MNKLMLCLGFCLITAIYCRAQSITPDPTFNSTGEVQKNVDFIDYGSAIAVQADRKVVVAGSSGSRSLTLMRYNFDGSLDNTFGNAGISQISFPEPVYVRSMVIDNAGRIVVGGYVGSATYDALIVRFLPDGTLDTDFNATGPLPGSVRWNLSTSDLIYDVSVSSSGDIIATGTASSKILLLKITETGILDADFGGSKGYTVTDIPTSSQEIAFSVSLDDTRNEMVVGGRAAVGDNDYFVAKYDLSNGTLNTEFAENGIAIIDIAIEDEIQDLILFPDGSVLVAGKSNANSHYDYAILKLNNEGNLDTSFGTNGMTITSYEDGADEIPFTVQLQANGKIVVGGWFSKDETDSYFLARYSSNGVLDNSFDQDGMYLVPMETRVQPEQMILDQYRIYLVGTTANFDVSVVALKNNEMALPSTILSINAKQLSNGIGIYWSTTNEANVSHYFVERSIDGKSFHRLSSITARNSLALNSYSFVDTDPKAINTYYRVIGIDYDGRSSVSKTIVVQGKANSRLEIIGSPSVNNISVRLTNPTKQLLISDMQGRVLKVIPATDQFALTFTQINISMLRPGMYILSDGIQSAQFIKL